MLAATTPHASGTALDALLRTARKPTVRIWAPAARFEYKDMLKARGYRWSDGSGDAPRAWWKDVEEAMAEAERIPEKRCLSKRRGGSANQVLHEPAPVLSAL